MSLDFLIKDWGEETFTLSIAVVDPAPDDKSENVLVATVRDKTVYFEAPVDAEIWQILEYGVSAIKEFLEYEPF